MFLSVLFLPYLIVAAIIVIPFWKMFERVGFSPPLSLLMLLPFVNVIMIFYLAFAEWPKMRASAAPRSQSSQGQAPPAGGR